MNLEIIGYDDDLKRYRNDHDLEKFDVGRVIAEYKERYTVQTEHGIYHSEVTGNLRFTAGERSDFPTIGDWVAVSVFDDELAIIHEIYPRKTVLERQAVGKFGETQLIAANVDTAFIIQAVDRDLNLNRLERYLAICNSSNIIPVIMLSKTDLIGNEQCNKIIHSVRSRIKDIIILAFSNKTKEGIDHCMNLLEKGKTYCFLGSSGVGKSTLINNITGKELMKINEISTSTGKGKHTTSHRELFVIENGGVIIDTPGMREVGIADSSDGINKTFSQIEKYSKQCKFSDCTHTHEKGCAVLDAVEKNIIDKASYLNYLKIKKEKEHFQSTVAEKRKKDKQFGKMVKQVMKVKKQNRY